MCPNGHGGHQDSICNRLVLLSFLKWMCYFIDNNWKPPNRRAPNIIPIFMVFVASVVVVTKADCFAVVQILNHTAGRNGVNRFQEQRGKTDVDPQPKHSWLALEAPIKIQTISTSGEYNRSFPSAAGKECRKFNSISFPIIWQTSHGMNK